MNKTVRQSTILARLHAKERSWLTTRAQRYGFAILLVLIAFGIRFSLESILGEELPFMLFIAAALVAARFAGAIPGFVAMLLGLCLSDYFFLRPKGTFAFSPLILLQILRYLFTASLGVILLEMLQRSRRRLQAAQELLRSHAAELEDHVAERTQSLSATVKSLEDILYHMSHNLRAPVRAMRGYPELLLKEHSAGLSPEAKEYLARIEAAAAQMDALIADMLDYGRVTHAQLNLTGVSLDQIVRNALKGHAREIQNKKAEVEVAGPLPAVRADPKLLDQVIGNLLDNALKFVAKHTSPRIRISVENQPGAVRVWIKDNGIGLDLQYRDRIFGAFEKLHRTGEYEGTGIGLAIVKQGVERMGGRVGLESGPNHGSAFWFELPKV